MRTRLLERAFAGRGLADPHRIELVFRLFFACASLLVTSTAAADAATHKPHRGQAAIVRPDDEPLTTGTIASKPSGATDKSSNDDETLPPPYHLPSAPRRRMRECGQKWQAIKMSGEVGEQIWRTFATRCLSAANGPFDKASNH